MKSADPLERQLDEWVTVVSSKANRHRIADHALSRTNHRGTRSTPVRLAFKIVEIGPAQTTKLVVRILLVRLGRR